jgi:hypothetical protein
MALWVLTYDQRATHHDYSNLYGLLNSWSAAHLQNSVWLADLSAKSADIRAAMLAHMHRDDTVAVIQIPSSGTDWATQNCRPEGVTWLKARFP